MSGELPPDPFDTIIRFPDACIAIGVAVLERFAEDETVIIVTVKRDGKGGWYIGGE